MIHNIFIYKLIFFVNEKNPNIVRFIFDNNMIFMHLYHRLDKMSAFLYNTYNQYYKSIVIIMICKKYCKYDNKIYSIIIFSLYL